MQKYIHGKEQCVVKIGGIFFFFVYICLCAYYYFFLILFDSVTLKTPRLQPLKNPGKRRYNEYESRHLTAICRTGN